MNKSLLFALAFGATTLFAASPDSYQVTGPIVEITDTKIVVEKTEKGKAERFEIARNAETKVTGELKVGVKVTIFYAMTAKTIEAKK